MYNTSSQYLLWFTLGLLLATGLCIVVFVAWINTSNVFTLNDIPVQQICEQLSPIIYRQTIELPMKNGVYEKNIAIALSNMSYGASLAKCANQQIIIPPGFTEYYPIIPSDQDTELNNVEPSDILGYIFTNKEQSLAAFVFSSALTTQQLLLYSDYSQVDATILNGYVNGVKVQKGIYNIYSSIRDELWQWYQDNMWVNTLFITGFSLGGAISALCAYDFADIFIDNDSAKDSRDDHEDLILPIHYTFGAPRVGNKNFATMFNQRISTSIRVNNTEDIVPQLPPSTWKEFNYQQTDGNVPFTISYNNLDSTHILSYYYNLPLCGQVPPCYIEE